MHFLKNSRMSIRRNINFQEIREADLTDIAGADFSKRFMTLGRINKINAFTKR